MRVDTDGKVAEVVPVQSALLDVTEVTGNTRKILQEFERTALQGARRWRFTVTPGARAPTPDDLTGPKAAAWRPQVRTVRAPPAWLTAKGKGPVNWDADMPLSTYGPLQLRDDGAGTTH